MILKCEKCNHDLEICSANYPWSEENWICPECDSTYVKKEKLYMWCNYCDPKFFVIYGFCGNCNRRCEPPLFDPIGDVSLEDWLEIRRNWNAERSDLMLDAMRRTGYQKEK